MQGKERLFFELSVLGVLASREAMEKRYSKTIEKTKTIEKFLGSDNHVESRYAHIDELTSKEIAVDV